MDLEGFCSGRIAFPSEALSAKGVTSVGISFIQSLTAPEPSKRPSASRTLQSSWLSTDVELPDLRRPKLGLSGTFIDEINKAVKLIRRLQERLSDTYRCLSPYTYTKLRLLLNQEEQADVLTTEGYNQASLEVNRWREEL